MCTTNLPGDATSSSSSSTTTTSISNNNNRCNGETAAPAGAAAATTDVQRVKVAIVGAGTSGLQCCNALMRDYGLQVTDIVILEARNRIGGRIHTTQETVATVLAATAADATTTTTANGMGASLLPKVTFPRDHGAAWVHGTGFDSWTSATSSTASSSTSTTEPVNADANAITDDQKANSKARPFPNPMMQLLLSGQEDTAAEVSLQDDTNAYDRYLKPVVVGNPWMRPRTVLHKQGQLALFVAGQQLFDDDNDNDDDNNSVISLALKRHFSIMSKVHGVGNNLFDTGRGMETASTSLAETVTSVLESNAEFFRQQLASTARTPADAALVKALTPFYMLLIECWYGCKASDLQLCEFTYDDAADDPVLPGQEDADYKNMGDFYGPHCTVRNPNGMESVLHSLLRNGVPDRILLEQEVTKISCCSSSSCNNNNKNYGAVTLETAAGLTVHADACVVTIPVGCLKAAVTSRVFETALSDEKLEAISYSKMGSYKKVFLTFDRIFWPTKPAFLGMVRRLEAAAAAENGGSKLGNCLLFDNLWAVNGIPSIEAVLFGAAGEWSIHKSESVIRDAVLEFMADAMGLLDDDLRRFCQSCHVTRWEEDPFSRGAYSFMALGALERHVEELRRPEWDGRLVFSGEATITEFAGSVHAALFSGMNAATEINAYLTKAARAASLSQTRSQEEEVVSTQVQSITPET